MGNASLAFLLVILITTGRRQSLLRSSIWFLDGIFIFEALPASVTGNESSKVVLVGRLVDHHGASQVIRSGTGRTVATLGEMDFEPTYFIVQWHIVEDYVQFSDKTIWIYMM